MKKVACKFVLSSFGKVRVRDFANTHRWETNHKVICLDLSTGMVILRHEANFLSEAAEVVFKTFHCLNLGFCFSFREAQMSVL